LPQAAHYDANTKARAKVLTEVDGWTQKQIAKELAVKERTIASWIRKNKWIKKKDEEKVEKYVMNERLLLARTLGAGEEDQLKKAVELMHATRKEKVKEENAEGEIVVVEKDVPDYRVQNEGLKRCMELTGTKMERIEHDHNVGGTVTHKYELPEKKPLEIPYEDVSGE